MAMVLRVFFYVFFFFLVPGFSLLQDSRAFLSFLIIVRVRVAERAYHDKTIKDEVVAESVS